MTSSSNNKDFSWMALDDFGPIRYFKYKHQAETFKAATGCCIKPTGNPEPVTLSGIRKNTHEYDSALQDCGPCLF